MLNNRLSAIVYSIKTTPLLRWMVAFGLLMAGILLGLAVRTPLDGELWAVLGYGMAVVWWWWTRNPDNEPARPSIQPNRWLDLISLLLIALAGWWSSDHVLRLMPLMGGGSDSLVYYQMSDILPTGVIPFRYNYYAYLYPGIILSLRSLTNSILGLILFQHLVRVGVTMLIYGMLRSVNWVFAVFLALALAVSPLIALYANFALTESLYGSLLILAIVLTHRSAMVAREHPQKQDVSRGRRYGLFILAGLVWGAITVFRPVALFLFVPILLYWIWALRTWRPLAWAVGMLCC